MRISHLYPLILALVVIVLGVTGYRHWHTAPSVTTESTAPAMTTTEITSTTTVDVSAGMGASAAMSDSSGTAPTAGTYTSAQVATHTNASSCWTTINGNVYDLTSWIKKHPGGSTAILSLCGHDGTAAFTAQHGGQGRPEAELASFKIGALAQ